MSKNESNWNQIFANFDIFSHIKKSGHFVITASQINKFREARLMVKFDQRELLPSIFKNNGLSILPLSRNTFYIGQIDAYHDIVDEGQTINIEVCSFPENIQTIDYENLYSEGASLLCAYNSGMIDDVIGEKTLFTVNGRMSTQSFDFNIKSSMDENFHNLNIHNSICEIDGGFEGANSFTIVEVKNFKVNNFIIRQLYYPFRLWTKKIKKSINLIFLTFSNDVFTFYKCDFADANIYNSIKIFETKKYMLEPRKILLEDIIKVCKETSIVAEDYELPFPQADDFYRIVDLLNLLSINNLTNEEITLTYEFDKRQTHYYTSAGIYLGLISKFTDPHTKKVTFSLSALGKGIMKMSQSNKYLTIAKTILEHDVFNVAFDKMLKKSNRLSKDEIIEIMKESNINMKKETISTLRRRASTISGWLDWIIKLSEQ